MASLYSRIHLQDAANGLLQRRAAPHVLLRRRLLNVTAPTAPGDDAYPVSCAVFCQVDPLLDETNDQYPYGWSEFFMCLTDGGELPSDGEVVCGTNVVENDAVAPTSYPSSWTGEWQTRSYYRDGGGIDYTWVDENATVDAMTTSSSTAMMTTASSSASIVESTSSAETTEESSTATRGETTAARSSTEGAVESETATTTSSAVVSLPSTISVFFAGALLLAFVL